MIEKTLEAFFRHALLILLPVIVIPFVVTAWVLSTPPQYEAQAGIWVERPAYLGFSGDELTRYLPPATAQRNRLVELMRTRSFISDVIAKTSLEELFRVQGGGDVALDQIFARDFEVNQNGDHLLAIRFRSEQRDTALDIVNSVVNQFKARASEDRRSQAQLAISFYQGQLSDADGSLSQARSDLAKYLDANPAVARTLATNGLDVARLDPQFAEFQRRVDSALRNSDSARGSMQAAQFDFAAGVQGDALGFRVVDAAGVSATPSRQLRKLLMYPIVALVAGVALGAALLLLFALSDRSVRSLADLAPESVILGVMPRMKAARVARGAGLATTRRGVGYVAGTALPLKPDRKAS